MQSLMTRQQYRNYIHSEEVCLKVMLAFKVNTGIFVLYICNILRCFQLIMRTVSNRFLTLPTRKLAHRLIIEKGKGNTMNRKKSYSLCSDLFWTNILINNY